MARGPDWSATRGEDDEPPREPEDPTKPLPVVRDPKKPIGPSIRKAIEDDVRRAVRQHGVLRIACDASCIDPEVFDRWMREDPHLARKIAKDIADCATADMLKMREGGRGFTAAKAALESLARTQKEWVAKSRTTLETQLTAALEELEKTMPPDQYAHVIRVLAKHA